MVPNGLVNRLPEVCVEFGRTGQTGFDLGSIWVRTGVAPNGLDPLDGRVGLVPTLLQEVTRTVRQGSWAIVNRDAGDAG
jgi:hypothetical protein